MRRIECFVVDDDPKTLRMWEIAENLHRAELTALERSEHIAEWVRLAGEGFGQPAQNLKGGRPGILSAATRDLGIERTEARRAVKVAGLAPEADA